MYDYPTITPENADDPFEAGEIDEILELPSVGIPDEEMREKAGKEKQAHRVFARARSLPHEQLIQMRGAKRTARVSGEALFQEDSRTSRGRRSVPLENQPRPK